MKNTLYLPEIREMLAEKDASGLRECCEALHPGRTAEFLEGLTNEETWEVLKHTDPVNRAEIFHYFDENQKIEMLEQLDRAEMAALVAELAPDDRVDLLKRMSEEVVSEILPLVPADDRRDIIRLTAYEEGTAGAVMTTDLARLGENFTPRQALDEIVHQSEELETIYYLYIVDEENHLRGLVSARELIAALGNGSVTVGDLMERDLVCAKVNEDQEEVAKKVARYDLLAIPVVDEENHLLGIITHDDVIDVMQEEAVEDAHRIGAVDPLDDGYLDTTLLTHVWKRGIWLTILFFAALLTAIALKGHDEIRAELIWLGMFIPLVISSGGNTGSQAATLIISALAVGDITLKDWFKVVRRELLLGLILGGFLALISVVVIWLLVDDPKAMIVLPATLILVVLCGTMSGATLPLIFHRLGLDPALMSTPLIAGIIDIVGILIYMNIALLLFLY